MDPIKVIIVDDHFLVRLGLKQIFSVKSDIADVQVVGEASTAAEFYGLMAQGVQADLLLLDLILPDESGVSIAQRVVDEYPDMPILVMSAETSSHVITELMGVRIGGFISKNGTPDEMLRAVECVANGGMFYGKDIAVIMNNVITAKSEYPDVSFTPMERRVLDLTAQGLFAKEIGCELGISHKTVGVHKTNIFRKLGINTSVELVKYCVKMGFVTI